MNTTPPINHDIVLVGGGHSHALVLRQWAMNPVPGVRVTLISRDVLTPYSGMLPGYIEGIYTFDDIHIDLARLCAWGGIRFIKAHMTGINLSAKTLQLAGRPDIEYDVLSLDTGSTPSLSTPGATEFSTPVKPVHSFLERWQVVSQVNAGSWGVVGAGAGGFELVMAMARRTGASHMAVHWFIRGDQPMSERPARVGEAALKAANAAGVQVHTQFDVAEVLDGSVVAVDGRVQAVDELLWCTGATGPEWPTAAGFETDKRGFISTDAYLQSVSHPGVFASGDIGTQVQTPSAKAGVYAVRQAPVLFHNLRAAVTQKAFKTYTPQRDFLSLVSVGQRRAIGSRSGVTFSGKWVWQLKNWIDVKFMKQFIELPTMTMPAPKPDPDAIMRCSGCGSKVPGEALKTVLANLPVATVNAVDAAELLHGGDDAARVSWHSDQLIQSVDQISALMDDPYRFGRIATLHALSDVYTQAAMAHSAQVILTLPHAHSTIVTRELNQLMLGIVAELNAEQCALIGGHTSEGSELQVGLVVNAQPVQAQPIQEGPWAIVLTQPLGVGVLFAGLMQNKASGVHIEAAIEHLLTSNRLASSVAQQHGMAHCTDVTGFGLLGHLHTLARRENVVCTLKPASVPLLDGVAELIDAGVQSSLSPANQTVLNEVSGADSLTTQQRIALTDPQTGGGLAMLIPQDNVDQCLQDLVAAGLTSACVIGQALVRIDTTESEAPICVG
jgi:selenide, water dikinase